MAGRRFKQVTIFSCLIMALGLLTGCSGSDEIGFDPHPWRGRSFTHAHPPRHTHWRAPRRQRPSVVTVRKGDTVYAISRRYNVEVRSIIDANHLEPPYNLQPGDRLKLAHPAIHIVRKGETGYSISRAYNVDLTTLMRVNHIDPPYGVILGQRLRIPEAAQETARRKPPLPPPPPRSGKGFAWPVRGRVISSFGAKAGGLHNDGVNIGAPLGTPVRAAAAGVVAYAGHELKGYGNLLLLRHAGGWVTAYAHNARLLVKRGQRVARGQQVALLGRTGNVRQPQLHFEIRRGTAVVNPLGYMR